MKNPNRYGKNWTYPEIQYLKDNWSEISLDKLAKDLGRNKHGILLKAYRIGLTDRRRLQENISLHEFSKMLGKKYTSDDFLGKLVKADFPISYYKVVNNKIRMVNLQAFIKWFKTHLHLIDIDNTEDGDFDAIEPNWLKEKRKADKMASEYKPRVWTPAEDERLKSLLNEFKYGYRELSIKLKRTEPAIKRRIDILDLKERPLKAFCHDVWKQKDIEIVRDMYLKGYKPVIIAEYVPKSELAIKGILERHNYFKDK